MKNTLTLQEVCIALSIEQSTLYRWMIRAKMQPKQDTVDKRKKVLTLSQVQELARMHGCVLPGTYAPISEPSAMQIHDERIANLEQRISELEKLVQQQQQQQLHKPIIPAQPVTTLRPPRAPYEAEVPTDVPDGSVLYSVFGRRHNVKDSTFRDHLSKHGVPHIKRPKPGRPHEQERWLTPADQAAAISFWQRNGTPYEKCDACPHGWQPRQ